jgi:putative aldouronate transport system substrate-binding protein
MNKFTGMILAAAICSGGLSGCAKEEPAAGASPSNSEPPRTLTVEVFDRGKSGQPPLDNNYWTRYVNENFGKENNVTVKYVSVPRTQEVDKLNVLMAANEAPDLSFTYDSGVVYNYAQQGGLAELDDYIDKYGPNLTKELGPDVLKYGKFGNKQYAIPSKRTMRQTTMLWIRKDWLDKLGLPLPTTRDEFYQALVAFRDKNPGKVDGVVPMAYSASSGSGTGTFNLDESFYAPMAEAELARVSNSNPWIMTWAVPEYKSYMKLMNKMYNEGLLSKDAAIDKTGSQAVAEVSSGKAGAFAANWDYIYRASPGIYSTLKKNVPGAELVPVDTFKNSQGKYSKIEYPANGMYLMVPKASKNADLVVKYLNWMADPKVTAFMQFGKEGEDYTLQNGIPVPVAPSTLTGDKFQSASFNGDYCLLFSGPQLGDDAKNLAELMLGYPGYESDVKKAAQIAMTDTRTGFAFTIPNASYAKNSAALQTKTDQMMARLITAPPAEFDSLYDNQVKEYMTAGGQAVLDENVKNYKAQTGK